MLDKLKTRKFWKSLAIDLLVLGLFFYAINFYQTRNTPKIAPVLQAQLISGESIDLQGMYQQSPVLIYFWGSWCPICRFTSSSVTDLAKEYQVLSIALSSGSKEQVKAYLKEHNYNFPVINDPNSTISEQWGVYTTPSILIINSQAEISSMTTGIISSLGLKFRLWLASF